MHGRFHGAVLMLVLQNLEGIGQTWVVVSNVSDMFLVTEFQAPAGLAYVFYFACVAFEGVDTTSVVGYRLWY